MQSKKYLAVVFAAGLAAMTASNYLPEDYAVPYVTDDALEQLNNNESPAPAATVKTVSFVYLSDDVAVYSLDGGLALYSNGQEISDFSFTDDYGLYVNAVQEGGAVHFYGADGLALTDFTVMGNHLIIDVNGNIHTNSGILSAKGESADENGEGGSDEQGSTFDTARFAELVNKENDAVAALSAYVKTGSLDTSKYPDKEALINALNETYLEITSLAPMAETLEDEAAKGNVQSYCEELEALIGYIIANDPVYDENGGYELNTTKLSVLASVTVKSLDKLDDAESGSGEGGDNNGEGENGEGGSGENDPATPDEPETTESTTTTTKAPAAASKTTTTSKASTTTQAATQQQTAPVNTTTTAKQTTATTTKATTTTKASTSYTVTKMSKTIYALNAGVFYESPSLTSRTCGSFTKNYPAACTGVTNNGFYQILCDGYTVYALKSDFSEDSSVTKSTTTTAKLETGEISTYTKEMLKYVNALRKENGVAALSGYYLLDDAAELRAKELRTLFDHNRPDGTSYSTVYAKYNLKYSWCGENITYQKNGAAMTPEDAFNNWKNSEKHLANMLEPSYKYMAIGFYTYTDNSGNNWYYYDQLFYTPK